MHASRSVVGVGLLLAALAFSPAVRGVEAPPDYRDPDLLAIKGATTFPAREIKEALLWDFEVLQSTHPREPITAYLNTLARQVQAGYRHAGFADVQVLAIPSPEPRQVVVTIHEGPRCMAGAVNVMGAVTLPIAQLVERLTRPHPPRDAVSRPVRAVGGQVTEKWYDQDGKEVAFDPPVWPVGKPVRFPPPPAQSSPQVDGAFGNLRKRLDDVTAQGVIAGAQSQLYNEILEAFKSLGYHFPRFQAEVVLDRTRTTARLVISIFDEQGPTRLSDLEITGLTRHTREDILAYLDLKSDVRLTSAQCAEIRNRLWRSGRFASVAVTPQAPATAGQQGRLHIELVECADVTPLGKPLTEQEQILLRTGEWLADSAHWQADAVMRIPLPSVTIEVVASPYEGVLATLAKPGATGVPQCALLVTPEETGIYSPHRGKWFSAPALGMEFRTQFGWRFVANKEKTDQPYERRITFNFSYQRDAQAPRIMPMRVEALLDPAVLLSSARAPGKKWTLENDILETADAQSRWRIDAATGRVREFQLRLSSAKADVPSGEPAHECWATFTFLPAEFQRRIADLRRATAGCANEFAADKPFSSLGGFLSDEASSWLAGGPPRRLGALRLILNRQVLESFDDLALRLWQSSAGEFKILTAAPKPRTGLQEFVAASGVKLCDGLFPRGSWPWTLSRQFVFLANGKQSYVWQEMQRVYYADDHGPLCDAAAAALLWSFHRQAAEAFATRGKSRLTNAEFRKDYWLVLNEHGAAGKCLRRAAEVFRGLDERDLATLRSAVPPRYAGLFEDCVRALRHDRSKPLDVALAELLDALWADGLAKILGDFFERLAPAAAAKPGA